MFPVYQQKHSSSGHSNGQIGYFIYLHKYGKALTVLATFSLTFCLCLLLGTGPVVPESISEYVYLISFLCHFYFICSTTLTFQQFS